MFDGWSGIVFVGLLVVFIVTLMWGPYGMPPEDPPEVQPTPPDWVKPNDGLTDTYTGIGAATRKMARRTGDDDKQDH